MSEDRGNGDWRNHVTITYEFVNCHRTEFVRYAVMQNTAANMSAAFNLSLKSSFHGDNSA